MRYYYDTLTMVVTREIKNMGERYCEDEVMFLVAIREKMVKKSSSLTESEIPPMLP